MPRGFIAPLTYQYVGVARVARAVVDRLVTAFDYLAPRHDELDLLEHRHVGQRIAGDRDDVGALARLDRPDFARQAEEVGGVDRRRLQRLDRRHAKFDHQLEFVGVAAVLGDARVGAEGDLDARRIGLGERLAGDADAPVDLLLHSGA